MRPPRSKRIRYGAQKLEPIISGKYRLEAEIGRGAFALVYKARHVSVGSLCYALKVLRQPLTRDRVMLQRFHREAETAASLVGEHVVRVIDFGQTEAGLPFIVMPYLDGLSSDHVLERDQRLTDPDVARLSLDVLSALEEAHDIGVIHRDLKPSNIFVLGVPGKPHPIAKVLDFGLAKVLSEQTDSSPLETAANCFIGTPAFAAPEMLSGDPDPRSDLYSLGHTMACWLEGEPPYGREATSALTIAQHFTSDEVPLGPVTRGSQLVHVVEKALRKAVDERYASAREMADAIRATGLAETDTTPLDAASPPPDDNDFVSFTDPTPIFGEITMAGVGAPDTPVGLEFDEWGMLDTLPDGQVPKRQFKHGSEDSAVFQAQTTEADVPEPAPRRRLRPRHVFMAVVLLSAVAVLAWPRGDAPRTGAVAGAPEPEPASPIEEPPQAPTESGVAALEPAAQPAGSAEIDAERSALVALTRSVSAAVEQVGLAARVGPSNFIDLAADTEGVEAWLGDARLGALPLRGAYIPARRPLTLRFTADEIDERSVTFDQNGPVVHRLELARELRRRTRQAADARTDELEVGASRDGEAPPPEGEGEDDNPLAPRRTDLRNPFE